MTSKISALLVIDIQIGMDFVDYYGGERNNPDAEQHASKILEQWRSNGWPIYHVRHSSKHSDNPCLLYTSPSPRDATLSRMPSSA